MRLRHLAAVAAAITTLGIGATTAQAGIVAQSNINTSGCRGWVNIEVPYWGSVKGNLSVTCSGNGNSLLAPIFRLRYQENGGMFAYLWPGPQRDSWGRLGTASSSYSKYGGSEPRPWQAGKLYQMCLDLKDFKGSWMLFNLCANYRP